MINNNNLNDMSIERNSDSESVSSMESPIMQQREVEKQFVSILKKSPLMLNGILQRQAKFVIPKNNNKKIESEFSFKLNQIQINDEQQQQDYSIQYRLVNSNEVQLQSQSVEQKQNNNIQFNKQNSCESSSSSYECEQKLESFNDIEIEQNKKSVQLNELQYQNNVQINEDSLKIKRILQKIPSVYLIIDILVGNQCYSGIQMCVDSDKNKNQKIIEQQQQIQFYNNNNQNLSVKNLLQQQQSEFQAQLQIIKQ